MTASRRRRTRDRTAATGPRPRAASSVELDLDGTGRRRGQHRRARSTTTCSLSLAKHSLIDLTVKADGDIDVDAHHTVEDVAIVLGQALREALGDKSGIRRFGDATVPLDEALVQAVVDVAGRPYCVHTGEPEGQEYVVIGGNYVGSLTRHVLESLRLPRRDRPARARARRPRPAPHRRGAVQGGRPGAAGRRGPRPPRRRHPQREGQRSSP